MIYLDNAATTLIKPISVERAVQGAMRTLASPGRGGHAPAMRAAEKVFECREAAAELFHVPEPERIIFTMNATHALNIAIRCMAEAGDKVVVSGYEHNSVTRPLAQIGANIVTASSPLFDRGAAIQAFSRELRGARLAVCTHVSNAFGFILPVYEIAELCRKQGVPLIVDASQSAGVLNVDYEALGAAFIAMPGHKALFGPQGTGILICGREGEPLMSGGSGSDSVSQSMPEYLPDRLEAGTHNVCGIAGLLEGIRYVKSRGTETISAHERNLLELFASRASLISGLELFHGPVGTQSGVISARSARMSCEALAEKLSARGICVRSGLHCAPYAHRSAGTLETGTVRFSFSPFVSESDIENCCLCLKEFLQEGV